MGRTHFQANDKMYVTKTYLHGSVLSFMSSNISSLSAFGVYACQLIQYAHYHSRLFLATSQGLDEKTFVTGL